MRRISEWILEYNQGSLFQPFRGVDGEWIYRRQVRIIPQEECLAFNIEEAFTVNGATKRYGQELLRVVDSVLVLRDNMTLEQQLMVLALAKEELTGQSAMHQISRLAYSLFWKTPVAEKCLPLAVEQMELLWAKEKEQANE